MAFKKFRKVPEQTNMKVIPRTGGWCSQSKIENILKPDLHLCNVPHTFQLS